MAGEESDFAQEKFCSRSGTRLEIKTARRIDLRRRFSLKGKALRGFCRLFFEFKRPLEFCPIRRAIAVTSFTERRCKVQIPSPLWTINRSCCALPPHAISTKSFKSILGLISIACGHRRRLDQDTPTLSSNGPGH